MVRFLWASKEMNIYSSIDEIILPFVLIKIYHLRKRSGTLSLPDDLFEPRSEFSLRSWHLTAISYLCSCVIKYDPPYSKRFRDTIKLKQFFDGVFGIPPWAIMSTHVRLYGLYYWCRNHDATGHQTPLTAVSVPISANNSRSRERIDSPLVRLNIIRCSYSALVQYIQARNNWHSPSL